MQTPDISQNYGQSRTKTGQILSYLCGIIIAAIVVGSLILTFYLTSGAYAQQMLKSKSVAELTEIVSPLAAGHRPKRGPEQDLVLSSILLLGEGQDELQKRIDGIAVAGAISDTEYESAARIAVKNIGRATHAPLREMLDSGDRSKVMNSVICINLLGEDAKSFVPKLIEMVESDDPTIIRFGIFALQNMGDNATPAVQSLNDVIDSLDFNAQIMVCKTVIGIGRDAAPMADNLAKIYEEGIPSSRSWAGIALGAIGPIENFDTAEMLAGRVATFNHVEKTRALEGLALMGDEAASQQNTIKTAMQKPNGRVRPQAAYAYYRATGKTESSIETLIELLSSRDYRTDSLKYLRLMGPDAKSAIPEVRNLLHHENVAVRESAVLVLGNMGVVAADELAAIKKLASDPDPLLRQAVSEAVNAIERGVASKN